MAQSTNIAALVDELQSTIAAINSTISAFNEHSKHHENCVSDLEAELESRLEDLARKRADEAIARRAARAEALQALEDRFAREEEAVKKQREEEDRIRAQQIDAQRSAFRDQELEDERCKNEKDIQTEKMEREQLEERMSEIEKATELKLDAEKQRLAMLDETRKVCLERFWNDIENMELTTSHRH